MPVSFPSPPVVVEKMLCFLRNHSVEGNQHIIHHDRYIIQCLVFFNNSLGCIYKHVHTSYPMPPIATDIIKHHLPRLLINQPPISVVVHDAATAKLVANLP